MMKWIFEYRERVRVRQWIDDYVHGYNEHWGYCLREPGEDACWPNAFNPGRYWNFTFWRLVTRQLKARDQAEHR